MSIFKLCKLLKAPYHFHSGLTGREFVNWKMEMFQNRLKAEEIGRKFTLSDDVLFTVMHRMSNAIDFGLRSSNPFAATVKCWNTHVHYPFVDDTQINPLAVSRFLGLELTENTYFRTSLTYVLDTNRVIVDTMRYPIPGKLKIRPSRHLFNRVAECLASFSIHHHVNTKNLPLLLMFGFPFRQTALDNAVVYQWTKEFDCADTEYQDIVTMLRQSLDRTKLRVGPIAVLNDTSAIMLNSLADIINTRVGLMVDDGCNCCYEERTPNVREHAIINTEWGAFGEDGIINDILSEYDKTLDANSRHPGKQIFEKMTSGMYMAELVRKVVLEMATKKVLFGGRVTRAMMKEYGLKALHISKAESAERKCYDGARTVLTDVLRVENPTDVDCELFRYACECVTKRSAHLISAGLAGVISRLSPATTATTTVAVGGSVFQTNPLYMSTVEYKTRKLVGKNTPIVFRTAGHEKGAPFLAGMLARIPSKSKRQ